MIVAGLLALAVIASLFLIFSNSVQLLRVGLVVALWAATLGAIAMTKYRRESALDKAKVADLQTVYELQLEREISARREYELSVEGRVRREVSADAEELSALRAELVALRRNLEALFDGGLLPERPALKADSTRVGELGGGPYRAYQPAASGLYVPGAGQNATGSPSPQGGSLAAPSPQGGSLASPSPQVGGLASPNDGPVTAETTVVFAETSWRESFAKNPGSKTVPVKGNSQKVQRVHDAEVFEEPAPSAAKPVAPVAPVVEEVVVEEVVVEEAAVVRESAVDAPDAPVAEAESEASDEPRRRRRAVPEDADSGAHSNGLTVAEIMANLSSANSGEGSGRRRRRED